MKENKTKRTVKKKKQKLDDSLIEFVADFETTSVPVITTKRVAGVDVQTLDRKASQAWVCAWGIAPITATTPEEVKKGRNITQFLDFCSLLYTDLYKGHKITVFTHNLRFDGAFIIYALLSGKYKGTISDEVRDDSLYSFKVNLADGVEITFRDSSKIFPMKAEELGKLYGIPKLLGDWDYKKYRDDSTPISDEEWGYLDHDVLIVCKALKDYRDKGFTQNTLAAIAYNKRLEMTYPRFNKSVTNRMRLKNYEGFRAAFPWQITPLEKSVHVALMQAYFGGWTWLNPHFCPSELRKQGILDGKVHDVESFDENSMYPDKMANYTLPIGQPLIYLNPTNKDVKEAVYKYPCLVYHLTNLTIHLKDEYHHPMLMFPTDPQSSVRCQGKVIACYEEDVYLTNLDFEMMLEEYDIESYDIEMILAFNGLKGQYKDFVNYWMNEKVTHTNARNALKKELKTCTDPKRIEEINAEILVHEQARAIAKVMMNSSYGKDGTKLMRWSKTSKLDSEGVIDYDRKFEETIIEYYMASAVFITAWARYDLHKLLKAAKTEGIYSDTDSLKTTAKGKELVYAAAERGDIRIDDAELGAWKDEAHYEEAKFVRQKTYATLEDGKWSYTVCGAPSDIKSLMDIEKFDRGMIITLKMLHDKGLQGKLVPVSVTGGVILQECGFQISDTEMWEMAGAKNLPIELFVPFMRGELGTTKDIERMKENGKKEITKHKINTKDTHCTVVRSAYC